MDFETKIIVLVNGDQVIGRFKIDGDDIVQLNVPCKILQHDGHIGLALWSVSSQNIDKNQWIKFSPFSVISILTPAKQVIEAYESMRHQLFSNILQPSEHEKQLILN